MTACPMGRGRAVHGRRLDPAKGVIVPTGPGIPFPGSRVFRSPPGRVQANVRRCRGRPRQPQKPYAGRVVALAPARRRILSWIGPARQADTYPLRRRLFLEHRCRRARTV